ncbi:terminase gpA endonuclease subunit, partial [uncultured Deefgea sp.]|uniref:terminase gpA endonuclease subunit n=1 Tax=uncultured Deefgea sp. TaxID=1304914 RepID=UPI002594A9CE
MSAAALVFKAARRAVRPKLPLTVSEWADAHRELSGVGSAEKGRWKTSRTPYLREVMDCLSEDSPHQKVAFMKSSQVGGTECGSNWLGYIMTHAKGPVGVVMPTEKSMNDWMAQKFEPMSKETPAIVEVLASRSNKDSVNNAQRKRFTGGILYVKTAGSTTELKSTSLRYAMADEVDEYDWSTLQGDPIELLEVRMNNFYDRKLFIVSSPTVKDASRIEALFEEGDQRRYMLACPHCDERQHLVWAQMRWRKIGTSQNVDHAYYVCQECGGHIEEHHKPAMLAGGKWQAFNPGAPFPSFHINALYSPIGLGLSWAEICTKWLRAQGDPTKLMPFMNTVLGESWADRTHDIKPNILIE